MSMQRDFDKLAERVKRALEELRDGSPTDAMRTLETAQQEQQVAKDRYSWSQHVDFWK